MQRIGRGRRAAAVASGVVMLWIGGAALVPGIAAATSYTCSGGHLYADGQHVRGDRAEVGNISIGCDGDRVSAEVIIHQ